MTLAVGQVQLALLCLLSGFSALVYQVTWLRWLGLAFGVTVYAANTAGGIHRSLPDVGGPLDLSSVRGDARWHLGQ